MKRSVADLPGYVVRPQAYAALSPEGFAETWSRTLSSVSTSQARTAVAERACDGIVGFITVGPPRDSQPSAKYQLWALNIAVEHHGTGLAQHVMAAVLGDASAYLWVARGNDRAITFYDRHGFTADGTEVIDEQDGITEVRMVRHG